MTPYYADDAVTIFHADCREVIPALGVVDHVISDPPFSEETHTRARSNRGQGKDPVSAIDFSAIDFSAIDFLLGSLADKCRRWFIATMDWRHIAQLEKTAPEAWEFVRFGVWVKTNPMPQLTADRPANGWDGICYLHHRGTKKRWNGGGTHGNWIGPVITNGLHPTGKPLELMERLVAMHSDEGELILDPFGGSGTTALAAKNLKRRCILIERDEKYCEVSARRLSIRFDSIEGGLFGQSA